MSKDQPPRPTTGNTTWHIQNGDKRYSFEESIRCGTPNETIAVANWSISNNVAFFDKQGLSALTPDPTESPRTNGMPQEVLNSFIEKGLGFSVTDVKTGDLVTSQTSAADIQKNICSKLPKSR